MVEWLKFNSGEEYLSSNPSGDLMNLLVDRTRATGHPLTFEEASFDAKMFRAYHYAEHFFSFEKAAETAWHKVQLESSDGICSEPKRQSIVKKATQSRMTIMIKNTNGKRGNTWMRNYKRYRTGEIEDIVLKFYQAHGRLPKYEDVVGGGYNDLPSWNTLIRTLGPAKDWSRLIMAPIAKEEATAEEKVEVSEIDEGVEVTTSYEEGDGPITIDLKITVPSREKPIIISLTV